MASARDPIIVLSDDLSGLAPVPGLDVLRWTNFREELLTLDVGAPAWSGPAVIGVLLTEEDAASLDADPNLRALLIALGAEPVPISAKSQPRTVVAEVMRLLVEHASRQMAFAAEAQAASAEIRDHHAALQADYAELEAWIYDALAPEFKLARQWPATADTVIVGGDAPIWQPLPVSARGTVSLDLHIAEAVEANGKLTLTLVQPSGEELASASTEFRKGDSGWIRVSLATPVGGQPQDVAAIVSASPPVALSLGPRTSFSDLCAEGHEAPVAMRIYQTTSRMTLPPLHDGRGPAPADGTTRLVQPRDMGSPELLPYGAGKIPRVLRAYPDKVVARKEEERNAILVHPSAHRPVVARLPGLTVERLRQLSGIVQIARHDTMEVHFAIGAAPAGTVTSVQQALAFVGDWQPLLPAQWGEVWFEPASDLAGPVDLLLATAMPTAPFNTNAEALFRGFRVTGA